MINPYTIFICILLLVQPIASYQRELDDDSVNWGYEGSSGPENWYKDYPNCSGTEQSPINIPADEDFTGRFPGLLPQLHFKYSNTDNYTLFGERLTLAVQVSGGSHIKDAQDFPYIHERSDNISSYSYKLAQFHFHWGADDEQGSEHVFDEMRYAVELHLVHYNMKYETLSAAATEEDGLLVVGIMFDTMEDIDDSVDFFFEPLTDILNNSDFEEESNETVVLDLEGLIEQLDQDRYYTYPGSLTTPPCYQTVSWVLMEQPLYISPSVTETLRSYKNITKNYRPTQDSSSDTRSVISSFTRSFAKLGTEEVPTENDDDDNSSNTFEISAGFAVILAFAIIFLVLGWLLFFMETSKDN